MSARREKESGRGGPGSEASDYGDLRGIWASLIAQLVKNPPTVQETRLRSLGWEDPLEKGTATHSSILACRIPWGDYCPRGRLWSQTHTVATFTYRGPAVEVRSQQRALCPNKKGARHQ